MEIETIKIKYHVGGLEPVSQAHDFEWIDLRSAEDVVLMKGDFKYINLGVSMKLPDGYEAIMAPRSSTFKKYGILMTNGIGIIDNKYCGTNDIWKMAAYATRDTVIRKNDRICQFRVQKCQPYIIFSQVDQMEDPDRGGLGSTGVK